MGSFVALVALRAGCDADGEGVGGLRALPAERHDPLAPSCSITDARITAFSSARMINNYVDLDTAFGTTARATPWARSAPRREATIHTKASASTFDRSRDGTAARREVHHGVAQR